MKLRIDKPKKTLVKVTGGDEPTPPKGLTYDQINQWSDYAEANPNASFDVLWAGFQAKNPKSGIDKNILKTDLDKLVNANRAMGVQQGSAVAPNIHTGYSFPKMIIEGKDYGRVNADLKTAVSFNPQQSSGINRVKVIPKEATEIWQDPKDNEIKFVDPQTGDVMYADRTALNDPRIKKSLLQQQSDAANRLFTTKNVNSILSGR